MSVGQMLVFLSTSGSDKADYFTVSTRSIVFLSKILKKVISRSLFQIYHDVSVTVFHGTGIGRYHAGGVVLLDD